MILMLQILRQADIIEVKRRKDAKAESRRLQQGVNIMLGKSKDYVVEKLTKSTQKLAVCRLFQPSKPRHTYYLLNLLCISIAYD